MRHNLGHSNLHILLFGPIHLIRTVIYSEKASNLYLTSLLFINVRQDLVCFSWAIIIFSFHNSIAKFGYFGTCFTA